MSLRIFSLLLILVVQTLHARVDGTLVLLPKTWDHASTLPVAIWLHGYGANPSTIQDDAHYQETADLLNIAIVGVPATNALGADSFVWSEQPEIDLEQINKSLIEAERRSCVNFSAKMLFGFSQGAVVAAELAARHPNRFSGAIVLSPGANIFPKRIDSSEGNRRQKYFISIGAEEAAGNLKFAEAYHDILSALGSQVTYREVPGMKKHGRPPDWPERFREWTVAILAVGGNQANHSPEPTPKAFH